MQVRVEVLERQIAVVADVCERLHHGGPVGGAVEQRAEGFQRMVGALLCVLLQVDVPDALAEDRDPVLGELVLHDVAGVEMDLHMLAVEAVDEGAHLHRRHQVAVEEDVLDVQRHLQLLGLRQQFGDRLLRAPVADVVRNRLVIGSPRDVDGAGHDQQILRAQVMGRLSHHAGQFHAAARLGRIVAGQRIGPEQERAEAADGDADFFRHLANRGELLRAGLRRQVAVQIVVQFDAVEPGVLRQLQALTQRHLLRDTETPRG